MIYIRITPINNNMHNMFTLGMLDVLWKHLTYIISSNNKRVNVLVICAVKTQPNTYSYSDIVPNL